MAGKSREVAGTTFIAALVMAFCFLAFPGVSLASSPPRVKTEAATEVRATRVTLNGTVNPEGLTTGYHFECGETTSYGTNIGYKTGVTGTSNISVSESFTIFAPGTTYHCRLVASNEAGQTNGEDISFKTSAGISGSQLTALTVRNPFDASTASFADFESNWGILPRWCGCGQVTRPKGEIHNVRGTGWGPYDAYPAQNGTYYSPSFTDIGWGVGSAATVNVTPEAEGTFALWIDMPTPASSLIGYELRFTTISANVFKVTLYEWGGTPHELASLGSYSMANGSSVALVDQGSKISAWIDAGSGFTQVLSASDSTFAGGSAALQGQGNDTRMASFRAGSLRAPKVTTEAATEVKATQATLSGTLNPEGRPTSYYFEYGETTSYGTKIPTAAKEVGSGTSDIAVAKTATSLKPGTTYHFRVVGESEGVTVPGEDKTFKTQELNTASRLSVMNVVQPFDGSTSDIAAFESNFSVLGWAVGNTPKGADSTTGWHPVDLYVTGLNGAYFAPVGTDSGWGIATATTLTKSPAIENRYVSLWLDMPTPESTEAGYELRFTYASANTYTVTLSKWVEGIQTQLASKSSYTFSEGSSFALVDEGGRVSAWTNTGSGFTQLLSASDSTFEGGHSGLAGRGNASRLTNFKSAGFAGS